MLLLRRRRSAYLILTLLFALIGPLTVPAAFAKEQPLALSVQAMPSPAHPGETVTVTVTATIKPEYHIYSLNVPANGPQPTQLTLDAAGPLTADGPAAESQPELHRDTIFFPEGKDIGTHKGTVAFTQRLLVPKDAKPGAVPVKLTFTYQACTESTCLPPKQLPVETVAKIEAGAVRPAYSAAAVAAAALPMPPAPKKPESGGLGGFLLAAFGAGLLALITPCVFPMIPVTLAFFTKQATASGGSVVRLAGTYSLGIVLAFTGIGAILAATVGAAGANNLAANPWVNLTFGVLFVVFALALLEVFELRLPNGMQGLTGVGRKHGGTLGVLGMGLTFVIAAFTCTAPFIGTVLVAAANASSGLDWVRPILGMAVFSSALALPFFVLALFPSLLAKMPKSGAWLSTVKGTMGFIELAAAVKFLSNADIGWERYLLTQPVMLALWALIAIATALWLLGVLKIGLGAPEGPPTLARSVWATVFVVIAATCFYGLSGRPLGGWVVGFLPPDDYVIGGKSGPAEGNGLAWLPTLEEGIAQAKAQNKPILIDFTGVFCVNCRVMERTVFKQPEVKKEMEQFVRVRLYTDRLGDKENERNQKYQEKTFGDVTLPLYAVLTPDGKPIDRIGGLQPVKTFVGFLKNGREKQQVALAPVD